MSGGKYADYSQANGDLAGMRWLLLPLALIIAFVTPLLTSAQAPSPRDGITVTPSIVKLDLAESPPELSLVYKNTSSTTVELALSAEDFAALEDGWKVKFLDQGTSTYRYALASWLTFETSTLLLNPGEERPVKVFIDAERLSAGGHYASILAEIKQDRAAGQIGLRGILSSLLFVRTATGQEHEEAAIKSFSMQQHYFSFPTKYTIRFQNTGNVELTPYGKIEVKDLFGKVAATGILNEESLITLPESIRNYEVAVTPAQKFLYPGPYTARLNLRYGQANQETQATVRFFSFGTTLMIYIVLVAGSILAATIILIVRLPRSPNRLD